MLVECILRFIQPFGFRVKGNTIILPNSQQRIFTNQPSEKLDPAVIHTQNSLGFRGEDPPQNFSRYISLITVGGSTTESIVLNDSDTWTAILGKKLSNVFQKVWVNNAGIDGHTTFGHLVLIKNYIAKIHPDVVIFLVGINEVGLESKGVYDGQHLGENIVVRSASNVKETLIVMAEQSEIASILLNIYRYLLAKEKGLTHNIVSIKKNDYVELKDTQVDYRVLSLSDVSDIHIQMLLEEHKEKYIEGYRRRLEELLQLTTDGGSIPILVTQPAVYGYAKDDVTGADLSSIIIEGSNGVAGEGMIGKENWEILELYNDVTREVGREHSIFVIDLAREMPKSTRYYYDYIHFEKNGSVKVADILYAHLCPYFQETFSQHVTAQC